MSCLGVCGRFCNSFGEKNQEDLSKEKKCGCINHMKPEETTKKKEKRGDTNSSLAFLSYWRHAPESRM